MRLEGIELRRVGMALAAPFRSAHGTESERDILLVRACSDGSDGWGECVALGGPTYSPEYVAAADLVLSRHLLPRLLANGPVSAASAASAMADVKGHRMAKAAVEMALLDAELQEEGTSLAAHLGGTRSMVAAGVSLGIPASLDALVEEVGTRLAEGYLRVKLKIRPGWDVDPVRVVRQAFGPELALQVDANGAYRREDADRLCLLDEFGLVLVEQPLPEDDLVGSAALAGRLRTPVCLDESITSARAAEAAIALGACAVVNIKAGRVGGYLEARRVHDVCHEAGVPVWCGGMYETGLGRAANAALASLPDFTLPGDLSASGRYYAEDLTRPLEMEAGCLRVPTAPGIGRAPEPDRLAARTRSVAWYPAPRSAT